MSICKAWESFPCALLIITISALHTTSCFYISQLFRKIQIDMLTDFYTGSRYESQSVSHVHSFCKLYVNFFTYVCSIFINGNSNKSMLNIGTYSYIFEGFTLKSQYIKQSLISYFYILILYKLTLHLSDSLSLHP